MVDVDEPEGPGELLRIRSASICASDLLYVQWGSQWVLGHELAATTEDGTPVAIEGIFGCEGCELCDAGLFNLCSTTSTTALGMMADGGMSEWFRAPSRSLVPLPEGLRVEDACLVEPMAVAWHGVRLGGTEAGSRVAVVGGGAIGLMAVAASQAMGAGEVGLEARYPHQIELGDRLEASRTSGQYDIVIEAAGSESGLHRAVELARPGGTVVVLGVYTPDVRWPFMECFNKEVRTVPSLGYCKHGDSRDFAEAAALLAARPDLVDSLISHRFPIEDAVEAFRVAADKTTGAMRVVIEP